MDVTSVEPSEPLHVLEPGVLVPPDGALPPQLGSGTTTPVDEPAAGVPRRRPWLVPVAAVVAGALVFGVLSATFRMVHRDNDRRILQQQTDQAASLLDQAIGQVRGPLQGVARGAGVTDGDPTTFGALAGPLVGGQGPFARVLLLAPPSTTPIASVGAGDAVVLGRPALLDAVVRADGPAFATVDLLDARTIGYAVVDRTGPAPLVVYAEQQLADTYARGQTEGPWRTLDYAIYFDRVSDGTLLSTTVPSLPMRGTQASARIAFGDHQLVLVTRPIGNLAGGVLASLWWIVLVAGAVITAAAAWLLTRLDRGRDRAAALAAENARLFHRERTIAEGLQLGLLPQRLVPPRGGDLAARYWPAGAAGFVGGDLFDAFRIDDRRWGLVIGDVCGKGIEAAGLTGLVRYTLRSAAHYADSPGEALRAVHRAMADHEPPTFCTVCFAVYTPEPAGEGGELVLALGGHLPPLHVRDGRVTPLGRAGTILGMIEPTVHDVHLRVEPGDTLVLVTDGLTDARGDEAVSLDELAALLRVRGGDAVGDVADAIGRLKRSRRPRGSTDDTAVLVVRFGA